MTTDSGLDKRDKKGTVASTPQLRRLGRVVTAVGIAVICAATLTPASGQPESTAFCILCGSLGSVDFLLNLLLFIPLGIGLALSGSHWLTAVMAMFGFSAAIEISQFLFINGRDASIGDIISNGIGGATGFVAARGTNVWRNPRRRAAVALAATWSVLWLSIQVASSYAFTIDLPGTRYYGQIARVFENMATFGGEVLSATIDTVAVPNSGFEKTAKLRDGIAGHAPVAATVIPAGPTPRIAPILRVADEDQNEITLLGQNGSDLVFSVRTGAANLRLRPQLFALRGVFPARGDGARLLVSDTLSLLGRFAPTVAELRADSSGVTHQKSFAIYPALAWTLILPAQWYLEGTRTESVLSFLWVAGLLMPLGYWAAFLVRPKGHAPAFQRWSPLPSLITLLLLGLTAVPLRFGLRPASLAIWLAAVIGLALGATIARPTRQPDAKTAREAV